MTSPNDAPSRPDFWQRLAAYADGELDAAQCRALLREAQALPDAPEASRCAEHQRQLRTLLAGCMDCQKTMRCPDELRRCIEGIAQDCGCDEASSTDARANREKAPAPLAFAGASSSASAWRWGIAAALLFALIGGMYALTSPRGNPSQIAEGPRSAQPPAAAAAGVSLASFAERRLQGLVTRHVRCSAGLSSPGNTDAFATDPDALAGQVADTLDCPPLPVDLDLAPAGLTLRLAGRCTAPGPGAMHLIYDAAPSTNTPTDPDTPPAPTATVSLWIKPYDPHADPICTPGHLEVLADDGTPHPVMLWRDERLMYVLVGDAMPHIQRAQQTLTANAI